MDLERSFTRLEQQYALGQRLLEQCATARSPRSAWSVGQHLCHVALADQEVCLRLGALLEDPAAFRPMGGPRLVGRWVLFVGRIPRGRGQAPARVQPPAQLGPDAARLAWLRGAAAWRALRPQSAALSASRLGFEHAVFGPLRARDWVRYLAIHGAHHLSLAREIAAELTGAQAARG